MSLSIFALISTLSLFSPPGEEPPDVTETSPTPVQEDVGDTSTSPSTAEVDATAAISATPEPEPEVSPLVPRSQIEFLRAHPVDLERVQFRPGKGLSFTSKSKKFALTLGARVQLLYTLTNDNDPEAEPAVEHSFQIRRARLVFAGHMFGEHNKFKLELSISPRDVGLQDGGTRFTILRDYYLEFDYLRDLTVRVGQYKVPYSLQRVISSGRLQLNDRSVVGSEFDFDRDIGLDLRSEDFLGFERMRYYLGVYFGGGRDNFAPEPLIRDGGLVYVARFEVLPFGLFNDYVEGDFVRTRKPRLALGGAYSYMDDAVFNRGTKGSRMTDGGTTNYHNATASVAFKIVGLSLLGEFFWRRGVRDPGDAEIVDEIGNLVPAPIEAPRNGLGWYTQLGFMIPRAPVELAARFSQIRAIGPETATSMTDRNEVGGGVNWYIAGHPFKLQADYFRIWQDDIGRGIDQVRVQLQLSF